MRFWGSPVPTGRDLGSMGPLGDLLGSLWGHFGVPPLWGFGVPTHIQLQLHAIDFSIGLIEVFQFFLRTPKRPQRTPKINGVPPYPPPISKHTTKDPKYTPKTRRKDPKTPQNGPKKNNPPLKTPNKKPPKSLKMTPKSPKIPQIPPKNDPKAPKMPLNPPNLQ